jgi:hypothetical protein
MAMDTKQSWLFPLMVLAAGSVTVFGCIGIAAIIGYLPLTAPEVARPDTPRAIARVPLAASRTDLTEPLTAPRVAAPKAGE